jgi:hypothetical protein
MSRPISVRRPITHVCSATMIVQIAHLSPRSNLFLITGIAKTRPQCHAPVIKAAPDASGQITTKAAAGLVSISPAKLQRVREIGGGGGISVAKAHDP